ncbi:MAG TPA: DNA-formamidopyrimidine glycosylase family protein [Terrimicrobiaceae bacterium]|nr:DNA-formamidopyrimidine glycosylase family protein [Terrimicrobiaceae bacterium]
MPELAEVEYFRRRWDAGLGQRVMRVALHGSKRVFRGSNPDVIEKALRGGKLLGSETCGKQIAIRFSRGVWLGIHLGMSGKLRVEGPGFVPGKHDHLALFQRKQTLLFSDPRMFGRLRFHTGSGAPDWWASLPPAVTSPHFTITRLRHILQRRRRTPLKALLLMQEFFPGIGNWMADEILWQTHLHPRTVAGTLEEVEVRELRRTMRSICRIALKTIGVDWSDPPADWLIHQRWTDNGHCPTHAIQLERATVGGRTTVWCERCQRLPRARL